MNEIVAIGAHDNDIRRVVVFAITVYMVCDEYAIITADATGIFAF